MSDASRGLVLTSQFAFHKTVQYKLIFDGNATVTRPIKSATTTATMQNTLGIIELATSS